MYTVCVGVTKDMLSKKPILLRGAFVAFTLAVMSLVIARCIAITDSNATIYKADVGRVLIENPGGMPALCRAANGDLLFAYSTVWEAVPPGGEIKLMRSTDEGKTWSRPKIIVSPESGNSGTWAGLELMKDGSLILGYSKVRTQRRDNVPAGKTNPFKIWDMTTTIGVPFVIRSADNGHTWGEPVRLAPELDRCYAMGRPLIAANGDVLLPLIPILNVAGKVYPTSGFVRSTDGGKTFGRIEFIANDPNGYSEVTLGLAKNGNIIAILRDRDSGPRRLFWQSVSDDNGRSWQQPFKTSIYGKMPDMLTLPSGRLLLIVGSLDCMDGSLAFAGPQGSSYAGLFYSDDNGKTWQKDLIIPSPEPINLVPFDAPVFTLLKNGDILVINCAADRRYQNDPLSGWTKGFHYVLNIIH